MPSPNSDEFHIAYIYLNIMFDQGPWEHATFQTVWPGLHFYLSWKIFQLSLFLFRERWDQMHRQQLGPTMVVMQNDVWINMRLFQTFSERTECWSEKNSSWRLAGDIWSALKGPMLINVAIDFGCHGGTTSTEPPTDFDFQSYLRSAAGLSPVKARSFCRCP